MGKRWLPLESNPDVINKFCRMLGLPQSISFVDVFGMDPELLAFVPKPVYAVVLLYPLNEKTQSYERALEAGSEGKDVSSNLYYMKQTIGNACGTIGVMHACLNNMERVAFDEGFFKSFLEETRSMSPDERAKALEEDDSLEAAHEAAGREGQTEAPDASQHVDLHFVCFVERDGNLYELDGRKARAINHGPTTVDSLLEDTVVQVKKLMASDPDNVNFTLMALAASQ
eukprot:Rmarinus@m.8178